MKKVILLIVAIFMASYVSFAKKDPAKVKMTLKDSTVVEGYLRSDLSNRETVISVSMEPEGKKVKYDIDKVEKLLLLAETDSSKTIECVPLHVFSSMKSGKGFISDAPMMLFLTYQGKNVNGYVGKVWVYNSVAWNEEPIAYYKLSDSQVAKPFLNFGTIFRKSKNTMADSFKEYPALVEELENGTLSTKEINSDPMLMVKELDKILDKTK
jgi:hypothetical protein